MRKVKRPVEEVPPQASRQEEDARQELEEIIEKEGPIRVLHIFLMRERQLAKQRLPENRAKQLAAAKEKKQKLQERLAYLEAQVNERRRNEEMSESAA